MRKRFAAALLFLPAHLIMGFAQGASDEMPALPKVRTVTAFVRLDRATYQAQVAEALKMLHAAKDAFTKAGYEVETIRITTQPFPEYHKRINGRTGAGILSRL